MPIANVINVKIWQYGTVINGCQQCISFNTNMKSFFLLTYFYAY